MLAPLPKPMYKTPDKVGSEFIIYCCAILSGISLLALGLLVTGSERTTTTPQAIFASIIGVLILVGLLTAAKNEIDKIKHVSLLAQQQFDEEIQHWQLSMARWNVLAYCSRCDSVCNLQTGQYTLSQNVSSLL